MRSTNVSSAETGEEEGILSKMVGIFRSDDGSSERGTSTTKDPGKVKMEKEMAKVLHQYDYYVGTSSSVC